MGRKGNGESSIYQGKDGFWHGRVTVGTKDDGTPDRRHIMMKKEADVRRRIRELERERDGGTVRKAGQRWTVKTWLTHWVENIAAPSVRDNTIAGYRVAVNKHLIPGLGAHRLEKLEPEHLERFYAKMQRTGSAAGTAHQAHRTLRTALNEAVRRGYLTKNPATLAKPPRLSDEEITPYSVKEAQRLMETASERRNSARWAIALSLGLRQGEALGLKWSDVDLDQGVLIVRRGRQRPRWQHSCGTPPCGRKYGGHCPERQPLRAATAETKSRAGLRSIGLPNELVTLLRQHQAEQEHERKTAGQLWTEDGWLFATPTGEPVNPRTDYADWKRLLRNAGLRDGRLHDARHTAATMLLILGVAERAVMSLMGWSNSDMAKRYQHLTTQVRRDIAHQLGGLLWEEGDTRNGEDGDGAVGVRVPA